MSKAVLLWRERWLRFLDRLALLFIRSLPLFCFGSLKRRRDNVLRYGEESVSLASDEQEERALPGFKRYAKNGYCRYMLGRYLFAIPYIRNKSVLDTGCGLGWGSYLIARYPRKIVAIDIDATALAFAVRTWKNQKIEFVVRSMLDLDGLGEKEFDVILGYETIEHLAPDEALRYLTECRKHLKRGGRLILSSLFPRSGKDAKRETSKNRYHKHIYTCGEMSAALAKVGFARFFFLGKTMLVAVA